MELNATLQRSDSQPELMLRFTSQLGHLLDAHGICETIAAEIGQETQVTTVVAFYNQFKSLYDVWVYRPGEKIEQTYWQFVETTIAKLANAGIPLYLDKFDIPAQEQIRSELWHLPHDGILGVTLPLPENEFTPRGMLCLIDPPAGSLISEDNLKLLATHLTVFLDRAVLYQKSLQQETEFTIVSELANTLTATLDLQEIYSLIRDSIRKTLSVESISIGLVDADAEELIFVNSLMGPLFRELPPIRLKLGQGIAGSVAQTGEPVIVNNAYADNRFFTQVDRISGFRTNSLLCVPLRVEQKVIGVLEAVNKRGGRFNKQDLRLLNALSGPLAVAIENAILHNDVVSEKRRIETMFASMSEGILTVNRAGWITATNDALNTILQKEAAGILHQPAETVIRSKQGNFADFMNLVFRQEEGYPQLACDLIQPNGGTVPVLISGAAIREEEGQISEAVFVFSDLREIREVERMRDDFFHNIIHELRTPLATILMYARLLREGKAKEDPEKGERFLGVIVRESDRLQRMVRQMLQLSKLEAQEFQRSSEPIQLQLLFEELLPPLADRATEKGLIFIQDVNQQLPAIIGHEETLYTIFKNLVENAIKFTLVGTIKIIVTANEDMVTVKISDTGIGIPSEAFSNLFKRFYRAATAVERGIAGTGLGLYMVHEGVEKHRGKIEVESQVDKGTIVTVRFPIVSYL